MPRSKEAIKRAAIAFRERWRNDPEYRARRSAYYRKFRREHPEYDAKIGNRFSGLKGKCKSRGYELSLTLEQYTTLVDGKLCHYCGAGLSKSRGSSLDRVDSSKGYSVDNCVPCCYLCNVMKSDMMQEQFFERIEHILNFRKIRSTPLFSKHTE